MTQPYTFKCFYFNTVKDEYRSVYSSSGKSDILRFLNELVVANGHQGDVEALVAILYGLIGRREPYSSTRELTEEFAKREIYGVLFR